MAGKATAETPAVIGGDWEEIQPFTQPLDMAEGDEFIAVYLGAESIDVPAADNDESAEVFERDGKRLRPQLLHEFQPGEGENFGVWGSGMLDKRMSEVPAGSRVKVLYEGKRELDGGRTARQYRVWQDKSASF